MSPQMSKNHANKLIKLTQLVELLKLVYLMINWKQTGLLNNINDSISKVKVSFKKSNKKWNVKKMIIALR